MIDHEFAFLPQQAAALGVAEPVVTRETFQTDSGRTVSALRFGSDAPEVTFLHGAGLNAHTWDTTVLTLGRPALVIDLPGHGDSAWRDDADYSPAAMGPDVAAAIASWTDRPQTLVGHSLGGMTAAWVSAHHPALVSELILVDITPGVAAGPGPAELRAFFSTLDFPSRDAMVDYAQSFGMGGDRAAAERGVFFNTRVRADGRVEWKHHFARIAAHVLTDTPAETGTDALDLDRGWQDLTGISVPIALVRGDHGYVTESALAEFRTWVPAATVHELASTHNVQEVAPAHLAEIIRAVAESAPTPS